MSMRRLYQQNFTFPTYQMPWLISKTLPFDRIHLQLIAAEHTILCCCLVIRKYSMPIDDVFECLILQIIWTNLPGQHDHS